uniref:PHD-type domain-containing protein n=1 Tax=Gasterosteus aculeatus aculeatus TaxID=481459 RepID=A0AAQ4RTA9_GASAC
MQPGNRQRETPASCSRTCKPFSGIGNERLFVLTRVSVFGSFQLFSSGLVCSSSPQFDDLFGFSVGDVLAEVKRGSKLMCSRCQLRGATAGCEVRRCKKSYHYPCAVQHKANVVEDADKGKYVRCPSSAKHLFSF